MTTTRTASVNGLTRAQLQALAILADGPAKQSNRTDPDARIVSWRTVRVLERRRLVIDVAGHSALLTDRGHKVAANPPEPPPCKYDHGTHACYTLDGCRCKHCKVAAAEYEHRRVKDNAYGRRRLVDADPIREHVAMLREHGLGLKTIAARSGVPHGALWKLVYGAPDRKSRSRNVRAATADKILAVTPADVADGARVPGKQTRARIRDLRAAGATWAELGEQFGMDGSNAFALANRKTVQASTARTVYLTWRAWKDGDWTPRGKRSRWEATDG